MDKLHPTILAADFDKKWWLKILKIVNYLCNLSLSLVTEKTPYEGWYSIKPNLSHLCIIRYTAMAKKKEAGRRKQINTKAVCCKLLGYDGHTVYRLLISDRQIIWNNNITFHKTSTWQISHSIRLEQTNAQDLSNNAIIIDQQALIDVRKDWPMRNIEPQTNGGNADRTTQLNLYKIQLELLVQYNQNHDIWIPKSTSQLYSDSHNKSRSTDNSFSFVPCIFSKSKEGQAPSQ